MKKHRECDRHHLFYWRRMYGKGLAKVLRQHWFTSVVIPTDTLHRAIHREVVTVPVPPDRVIRKALEHLRRLEKAGAITDVDSIEKRLAVLIVLFEDHPATRKALSNQLKVCARVPR